MATRVFAIVRMRAIEAGKAAGDHDAALPDAKRKILKEAAACTKPGEIGALLRR
jgi:hypothetical protein